MLRAPRAIFKRDFKKFLNNPVIVITSLLIPLMYLVVFGNALGGTISHIPVGVVQEVPPYNDTPLFTNAAYQLNHISQGSQNYAEKQLDVTVYPDESQAKQDLENGKLSAVIVFPSSVSNDNAVRLYVDSSDSITPPLVDAAVSQILLDLKAHNPIDVDKIYGDITYIQFFGVGVIMMAIFTSTSFGGGIALIKDRENGIHEGYLVTPVKRSSIIFGIISSGAVRAFIAGFVIFWIDLLVTGLTLQSFQDFLGVQPPAEGEAYHHRLPGHGLPCAKGAQDRRRDLTVSRHQGGGDDPGPHLHARNGKLPRHVRPGTGCGGRREILRELDGQEDRRLTKEI